MKKLQTVLIGLVWVLTSTAFASQKVIVLLKSKSAFEQTQNDFTHLNYFQAKGIDVKAKLPTASLARIAGTTLRQIKSLNALVMNVENENDLSLIQKNPNVLIAEKDFLHPLPKVDIKDLVITQKILTHSLANLFSLGDATPWGIRAINAREAWADSDYGSRARVMVLDSGIDKTHRSLRNNFETGKNFAPHDPNNTDLVDPNDLTDEVGHGTHVSGTIAAAEESNGFSGVAPRAHLLMGRVCYVEGCPSSAIISGLGYAIDQHVDVVSMSLGGTKISDTEKLAVSRVLAAKIPVVAAAGNDGTAVVGFPAALPGVISVGAVDSNLQKANFSQWGPELTVVAPGVDVLSSVPTGAGVESVVVATLDGRSTVLPSVTYEGSKSFDTPVQADVVDVGYGSEDEMAKQNVVGKIVLAQRGVVPLMTKISNALKAQAKAIVFYNNEAGFVHGRITDDGSEIAIGVYMIDQNSGLEMKRNLQAGKNITLSLSIRHTDYAIMSGTSMATPHVSGVVALVKSANKNLTPDQVKQILTSTAHVLGPNNNNQYGAGLVNAQAAVQRAIGR